MQLRRPRFKKKKGALSIQVSRTVLMVLSEAERENLFMASGHQVKEICINSSDRKGAATWWCACCMSGNVNIVLASVCRKSWIPPNLTSHSHKSSVHVGTNTSARSAVFSHLLRNQSNHPATDSNEGKDGKEFNQKQT